MLEKEIEYERMVEDALRSVVRETLNLVEKDGLPGEHHLYITFQTEHPKVNIPEYLKEKYPEEMTIVLQYKFWGLEVKKDQFQVTLSFNKVSEQLIIPFEAITGFADPAANFGLRFETLEDAEDDDMDGLFSETDSQDLNQEEVNKEKEKIQKSADIITLDRFRKK